MDRLDDLYTYVDIEAETLRELFDKLRSVLFGRPVVLQSIDFEKSAGQLKASVCYAEEEKE